MKIEIQGIKPLSAYEQQQNEEALTQYNEAEAEGYAPDRFDAPNRERPDILTIEDSDEKGMIILKSCDYGDPLKVSIEDIKRALKVF